MERSIYSSPRVLMRAGAKAASLLRRFSTRLKPCPFKTVSLSEFFSNSMTKWHSLHLIAAEVFVIQALKPTSELIGGGAVGGSGGIELGTLHDLLCDKDRAICTEG
jgi:hypothetical protein